MASSLASAAIREFELTLDEIDSSVRFAALASKLRPRLSPVVNREYLHGDLEQLVKAFTEFKDVNTAHLCRGLIVVISGAFEKLVRRIVEESVIHINSSAPKFDELSQSIRVQNIFFTGRALCSFKEPPDHLSIDTQKLSAQLASCNLGASTFTLNAEAFAMFITNLTPAHLSEVFRSIGITLDWDYFGRIKTFEAMFGTKGPRATGTAASNKLGELIRIRNRISHTGENSSGVDENTVNSYVAFFRIFSPNLIDLVEAKLPKVKPIGPKKS
ncbi:HEPN domain-containing protein [Prosthecobacter vanneervenii]|uniref:RiboL-PSP-HEPN domain-containing protein n=1 Tax=Prosthecobacter vanneervenii TaxID=48466 RepID=A0A7W8DKR5_9BACT|nr:HEPN domain-containing protein [Prosthecobacter vanneervenii]MBB5033407.1 hypothetical protein [Prosthecobacter vanneervenii]